ncbi:ferredoxin [Mycobacteroides abscessus]|uniref:ferredoxin n=1 Tax=Mycobacteroides abscessus TaxID=36809 RepID=UPI003AF7B663
MPNPAMEAAIRRQYHRICYCWSMRIDVDRAKCTGIGICESLAPDIFEIDDEGNLLIRHGTLSEASLGALVQAVEGCPTAALTLLL